MRISPVVLACTLVAFLAPALHAQRQPPRADPAGAAVPAGWAEVTRRFVAYVAADSIAGGAVVLVRDGRRVAWFGHGLQDRERREPISERTLFHYGSITKTLTAVAIMQLRDRGLLSLDDPVTRWVPELRLLHNPFGGTDAITIRMLLSHTAGFQDPTWPYGRGRSWEPFEPTRWEQLVAMMPYQEIRFLPGSRYGYSNPGFIYLARIIEAISGDPFQSWIYKNIWQPLGMDRSYFGATPLYLAADRSNNYTVLRDGDAAWVRANGRDFDPGITIPNGGWNAPLADLVTWAAFLTGSTGGDTARERRFAAVLARSSLEEMWRPIAAVGGDSPESMGLSFFVRPHRGQTLIGHTGWQAGFRAFLYMNPRRREAIILAVNTSNEAREAESAAGYRAIIAAAADILASP
jgi:CubicO group peptidase (beta-lactamase class C family)